jgi:alkanesulfonate monooxygenase SsuD/methylene tetrahydromethanopterin reductase-like flavin-dependent oxidoreductase (luciferase family)
MKIGIALPTTGDRSGPSNIADTARYAEASGLDSVWTVERILLPATSALPAGYAVTYDPLDTLAWVAALTNHMALGVSAMIAPFHPPVTVARRLATIDQLSGGRLSVAFAQGHVAEELALHNVAMNERVRRTTEMIKVVRAVWGPDPVRYDGMFTQISPSAIGPKPRTGGGPSMLMAANHPAALERSARLGVGWNALFDNWDAFEARLKAFREAQARHGATGAVVLRVNSPEAQRDTNELAELTSRAASAGVDEVFFDLKLWDAPPESLVARVSELRERIHGTIASAQRGGVA